VQADLTRGKREREGSPKTEKYERGGPKQGHDFSNTDRTDRATQESAIPESRATRATTSPIARDCDRVLTRSEGLPTVQNAKRDASRSAG